VTNYTYTDSFAPESTLVKVAYYHRGERKLFIQFTTGAIYGYDKVTSYIWDKFVTDASAGNFYNVHIKGKYGVIEDIQKLDYIGSKVDGVEATHKFVIVGVSPIQYEFEGATVDDAMADFNRLFPEGTLKEVRVSFE
jgi:hypothetical protein